MALAMAAAWSAVGRPRLGVNAGADDFGRAVRVAGKI